MEVLEFEKKPIDKTVPYRNSSSPFTEVLLQLKIKNNTAGATIDMKLPTKFELPSNATY
jgi:hypothetical protein